MEKNLVKDLLYKYSYLGEALSDDGAILIGKATHLGPKAWLNILYPVLNTDELEELRAELKTEIPDEYSSFLCGFGNGISVLSSTFSLYGLRRQFNRNEQSNTRQPFSILTPNLYERPMNALDNYFFIGGYNWDGSHIYIDKETNMVHCCERWDATSKNIGIL